jgi:hypothetical protein
MARKAWEASHREFPAHFRGERLAALALPPVLRHEASSAVQASLGALCGFAGCAGHAGDDPDGVICLRCMDETTIFV